MKEWVHAKEIVAKMSGGKITPSSGVKSHP